MFNFYIINFPLICEIDPVINLMNTLLETLPPKEKDLFKQVITHYDDKKFKKALKLLNKLIEINPAFTGLVIRIHRHERAFELLHG